MLLVIVRSPSRPLWVTFPRPEACSRTADVALSDRLKEESTDEISVDCRSDAGHFSCSSVRAKESRTAYANSNSYGFASRPASTACRALADTTRGSMDHRARAARHPHVRSTACTELRVHGKRVRHGPERCDQERFRSRSRRLGA